MYMTMGVRRPEPKGGPRGSLENNKAGYTAISCGRVGMGGNAHFHTFRLVLTNGRTDGRTDGRTKPLIELRVRN